MTDFAGAQDGKSSPDKLFDYEHYEAIVDELAQRYQSNTPYPHITFDALLADAAAAKVTSEFPLTSEVDWIRYRHVNENKASTHDWRSLPPTIRRVVEEMNSPRFVELLSRITGIDGLMADPDIDGGGMHLAWRGGFLNVHTDFTMHRLKPSWRRRCNLILYVNRDWNPGWGGALEIWDSQMKRSVEKVDCIFNHAVLFNTPDALHGFPEPLTCPDNETRKSLQWYYYTMDSNTLPEPTTYFARPTDSLAKKLAVRADNLVLRAYSATKRALGLSDNFVSRLMSLFSSRRHR